MISFEEFQKIELKVAKIIGAEKVKDSEKLLKLQIDLGDGPSASSGQEIRQLVAGIAKFYQPEDLIGKEIIVVANLEPRILFNLESQGMLLAADKDGEPILLMPDKEVPPGTKIR